MLGFELLSLSLNVCFSMNFQFNDKAMGKFFIKHSPATEGWRSLSCFYVFLSLHNELFPLKLFPSFSEHFSLHSLQVCSRYGRRRFVVRICSTRTNISIHRLRHNRPINSCRLKLHLVIKVSEGEWFPLFSLTFISSVNFQSPTPDTLC